MCFKVRMIKEIILPKTKYSSLHREVFKIRFVIGEFDMVIFDKETLTCEVYEIKYSNEIVGNKTKHLNDLDKCLKAKYHFKKTTKEKFVYRENSIEVDEISHINVEENLKKLLCKKLD